MKCGNWFHYKNVKIHQWGDVTNAMIFITPPNSSIYTDAIKRCESSWRQLGDTAMVQLSTASDGELLVDIFIYM